MDNKYVFHVHTHRCGHASDEADEDYIKKAIELGAISITFTDHAPFPGNPFTGRMDYSQLDEYISSLKALKLKYKGIIDVCIGLEIEYLPSYKGYYEELKANDDIELLLLGQHHYELEKGKYSFELDDKSDEHIGLIEAMIDGIDTGYFDVIAHPDRAFRRIEQWNDKMSRLSEELINTAIINNIYLEKNYSSMRKNKNYWEEFWRLVPDKAYIVYGCDAHSTKELKFSIFKAIYYYKSSSSVIYVK